jgi:hypothetical protein
VDSTVFDDAVATQDTVTQLVAAVRKVARVVPGAAAVIAQVYYLAVCSPSGLPVALGGVDYTDPGGHTGRPSSGNDAADAARPWPWKR